MRITITRTAAATAAALALALLAALPAAAIVPPKNCRTMTVDDDRFTIKADQLTCDTARRHARRFLRERDRPSGYRCKEYDADETKMEFRCSRGDRVFFAIRR